MGGMKKRELSAEKKKFYNDVRKFMDKEGRKPSPEEISNVTGYKYSWIMDHIGHINTICRRIQKGLV